MRIKFWNRLLIAFCGLITVALGFALFAYGAGFFPFHWDLSRLDLPLEMWQRAAIIVVSLALVAVGIFGVCVLFRRGRDKGFIIQHTEYGDMSISMNALENMVKKCVQTHSELIAGSTRIYRSRDGVVVSIRVTLNGGANIPLTVNALQKQIKQYITSCSGVDVKEVRVMVETNVNKLEAPEPPEADDKPVAEAAEAKHEESRAHSIFSHTEEPRTYAPEPQTVEAEEPQIDESESAAPDEAETVAADEGDDLVTDANKED